MNNDLFNITKEGKSRIIGRNRQLISAVLIAIFEKENKRYIILEKRAKNIRQGGEISLPGGVFEKEDIITDYTAIRETSEELGIPLSKIQLIEKFGTLVNPNGLLLDVFIGKINIEDIEEMKYNKEEVENLLIVPIKFFLETEPQVEKICLENIPQFSAKLLNLPERYGRPWSGRARKVFFYKYNNEIIWGITAEILYEFIECLKEENQKKERNIYDR